MKLSKALFLGLIAVPAFSQAFLWEKEILFTDPNGTYLYSGSVEFTQVGTALTIVLTNTAEDPADFQRRVLNAVFWDFEDDPILTGGDAFITAGSTQINGGDPPANIDDHWGFRQTLPANQYGNANYGISSVGIGLFGPSTTFSGTGPAPNGTNYGLVPAAGTSLNSVPYVMDSMTFTFNLPVGYTLTEDSISNVWFQYGSIQSEFFFNVPEPGSMTALGLGALALISRMRRKKQK
jgi:hypothetical protein